MQRIAVVGNSGAGKTTLSARLAARIGAPHIELDSIRHQPGWVELPDAQFTREVEARTRGERWVVDGNYPVVRDLVWSRAELVVWIDPPRHVVTARVVFRTLRRVLYGEELWNGNRERWADLLSLDPQRSVVAWAWSKHAHYRLLYPRLMQEYGTLRFERLVNAADAERLIRSLPEAIRYAFAG